MRPARIMRIAALACLTLLAPLAVAEEKPAELWPAEGYGSLRAVATAAKAEGQRLLIGLSGGDH